MRSFRPKSRCAIYTTTAPATGCAVSKTTGRKEPVPVDEYTVEHILPQNRNLSRAWRDALGEEWQTLQESWLHTLGNLTLTGYNSEYSDRPFAEKRDMEGGFAQSPLRLNQGLAHLENLERKMGSKGGLTGSQAWG